MGVGLGGGAITAGTAHAQLQANPALQTWLIEFVEPGLVEFQRDLRGASADRFNPREANTQAYMAELMAIQAERKADLERAAGRPIEFTHHYLATHSGVAARLSADEAEALRGVPGVARVEIDVPQQLDTFNGPTFIGAGGIWDGSNVPSGANARGQGMVAAILDSGLVSVTHPSFANDAACGFSVENPKVLSNLDCSSSDGTGLCNGTNPTDTNGHGTHTASTVAGNVVTAAATPAPVLPPGFTYISGVAPCAKVRSYKVCPGQSCPGADIQAGMNSVLLHGDADVMNFSISGGTSPWTDNDRRKLDLVDAGVFVAASAGNTSTSVPNPIGQVNHRGPWVLSVAASTHDAQASGLISVTGPGTPPGNTQNIAAAKGSDSPNASNQTNLPIRRFTGQPETAEGCTAGVDGAPGDLAPFPAGFFNGAAALISRGTCPFTTKITNAFNAGAALVIIRNNQAAAFSMSTPGQPNVPAYSVEQGPGNALRDFVTANPTDSTINFDAINGDVLAGFSLRGPTPAPLADLTKPDITAPGVSIYAAYIGAAGYSSLSGTSMSGPHAAGSALLIKQVQPTWTDAEIKSALMMTAKKSGRKDNVVSDWDWDDVGSGRVDLTKAARAGLVMHETTANYLAANPATAGDVKTLNIPAVRNMNCTPNCSWTRTVRNTLPGASSWTAAGANITPGFDITVSPSSFSFTGAGVRPADTVFFGDFDLPAAPETQVLTITATPTTNLTGAVAFGEVNLTETGARSPQQHITVSIRGQGGPGAPEIEVTPASVAATGTAGGAAVTAPLTIGNVGGSPLNWSIAEAPANSIVLSLDDADAASGAVPAGGNPITLQLDDGSAENGIGLETGGQFVWLNRFTPAAGDFPITLNQVQILFRTADEIAVGASFDVYIYSDADGNPGNGATFVAGVTGNAVSALDVFNTVNLPPNTTISGPGDILVAVVNRTGMDGASQFPAAIDQTASQVRSWVGFGASIPNPPVFPTATFNTIDSFGLAGNWMVRATGTSSGGGLPCDNPADVPWLSVSPTAGSTAAGASSPVTVSLDPASLAAGTYNANLCVTSNDPTNPLVAVPVAFTVESGTPPAGFCSAGPIELPAAPNTSGPANPYPVTIAVTGVGVLDAVRVRMNGVTHTWPDDLDVLLVGPSGQTLVIQSDAGLNGALSNVSYIIDDAAAQPLPDGVGIVDGGSYRPANYGATDPFPAPAPAGPFGQPAPVGTDTLTSVFGGTNADGTWNVFIVDDSSGDFGSMASVCLEFDSSTPPTPQVLVDTFTGAFVTHPTGGFGGAPASRLQTTLGMNTIGANANAGGSFAMADDITVPAGGWQITRFTAYAYQTGGTTTSSLTGLRMWILDGPPDNPASNIVFGDDTSNVMTSTAFTGIYRDTETQVGNSQRPVYEAVAEFGTPINLPAGQYWIAYSFTGSIASGPWAPPRTILGQTVTGDAFQRINATTWQAFNDTGTGTPRQGMPFIVEGFAP